MHRFPLTAFLSSGRVPPGDDPGADSAVNARGSNTPEEDYQEGPMERPEIYRLTWDEDGVYGSVPTHVRRSRDDDGSFFRQWEET